MPGLRLFRGVPRDAVREIWLWIAIAWLPLAALATGQSLAGGPIDPLLVEPAVHARFLAAVPLVVIGRRVITTRCHSALLSLEDLGTLDDRDRAVLDRRIRSFTRIVASPFAETLLLILAVALMFSSPQAGSGAAASWYRFVSLAVFRFTLLLALFRWLVWFVFLLRVSRIPLDVKAAHPDGAGGLAFLGRTTPGIALVMSGVSAVVAAQWHERVVAAGSLGPMITTLLALVGLALVLAFAPLAAYSLQIAHGRLRALARYEWLGQRYVRRFEAKHVVESQDPELLGSPDIQSLADLGTAYDVVRRTRIVPFDRRAVAGVVLLTAAPAVVLALATTPTTDLVVKIARAVFGVR